MGKVTSLSAREILDSRGIPTIEGVLTTDTGASVYVQIPSGETLGKHEGMELRDEDPEHYNGKGVLKAVSYINQGIAPKLLGVDVSQFRDVDAWLLKADGTEQYNKLGVNTILTISLLFHKAQAQELKKEFFVFVHDLLKEDHKIEGPLTEMPSPIFTMLNGGKHGTRNLDFQEFHLVPSTSMKYSEALKMAVHSYATLKNLLSAKNANIFISEEGGFTPNLFTNAEAFDIMLEGMFSDKLKVGLDVFTGIDCTPQYYYKDKRYLIKDNPNPLSLKDYIETLVGMVEKYNTLILEDPLFEDDLDGWKDITSKVGKQAFVVGDDLIAGDKKKLQKAIEEQACNAVLVKFNQVATLTEMLSLIGMVKKSQLKLVVSHRLGETSDSVIVDIAVGAQADFVKFGAPVRGERIAKYNRLTVIQSILDTLA